MNVQIQSVKFDADKKLVEFVEKRCRNSIVLQSVPPRPT